MQLEIISIIVSGMAIILSSYFAFIANRTNKKVNQKDFEISENLKYDLMKTISVIRSYETKAGLFEFLPNVSFENEVKALSNLMLSPSYLLLIESIPADKRETTELRFNQLIDASGKLPYIKIKEYCRFILSIIKSDVDFKGVLDINVIAALHQFCEYPSTVDALYERIRGKRAAGDHSFDGFVKFLKNFGVSSPDLDLCLSRIYCDEKGVNEAIKKGANYHLAESRIMAQYEKYYKLYILDKSISEKLFYVGTD